MLNIFAAFMLVFDTRCQLVCKASVVFALATRCPWCIVVKVSVEAMCCFDLEMRTLEFVSSWRFGDIPINAGFLQVWSSYY